MLGSVAGRMLLGVVVFLITIAVLVYVLLLRLRRARSPEEALDRMGTFFHRLEIGHRWLGRLIVLGWIVLIIAVVVKLSSM